MFIDYITLMLFNMAAGFAVLAAYVWVGFDDPDQKRWSVAFGAVGIVALLTGTHMIYTWPLPGSYNSPYGELTVMLGVLFLAGAVALPLRINLLPLSIYAVAAGLAAVVAGARFMDLKMSMNPVLTGIGFILPGLCGLAVPIALKYNHIKTLRALGSLVLLAAAGIWALTGYGALWQHLEAFSKWVPPTMK